MIVTQDILATEIYYFVHQAYNINQKRNSISFGQNKNVNFKFSVNYAFLT